MSLADWYNEHVVPPLIQRACSSDGIMKLREKVVPLAHGRVLEIGCGGGINQAYFDRSRISAYCGVDPSVKGLAYARETAAAKGFAADLRLGEGEDIPFGDRAFDTVVCTFTLCSVRDQRQTLAELRRVLVSGGQLLFAEHGKAPDSAVEKWQHRIDPLWSRLAGGCHITREMTAEIARSGFTLQDAASRYVPKVPRWAGWMEWGVAIKQD